MAYETAEEIIRDAESNRGDAFSVEIVLGVGSDVGEHIELSNPGCLSEITRLLGEGAEYLGSIAFFKSTEPQEDGSAIYRLRSEIRLAALERKDDMRQLEKHISEEIQRGWVGWNVKWEQTTEGDETP